MIIVGKCDTMDIAGDYRVEAGRLCNAMGVVLVADEAAILFGATA